VAQRHGHRVHVLRQEHLDGHVIVVIDTIDRVSHGLNLVKSHRLLEIDLASNFFRERVDKGVADNPLLPFDLVCALASTAGPVAFSRSNIVRRR